MAEAMVDPETRWELLNERLQMLEDRVARIEQSGATLPTPAAKKRVYYEELEPEAPVDRVTDIALTGRSLIAIGGAYLLRALTDSQVVPNLVGLSLGVIYALMWIWFADRQAKRGDLHASAFSASVASLIAYPLIWEANARFHSFTIEIASAVLLAITAALLAVAWRNGFGFAGWLACLGSIGGTGALIASTDLIATPLIAQSAAGALLWHICSQKNWKILRWPAVAVTWIIAVPLQVLVAAHKAADSADFTAVTLLIVSFAYLGAIAAKNILARENITWTDIIQAFGTILFVLTGAARISAGVNVLGPQATIAIGIVAVFAYFMALRQPPEDTRAAYYFGGLAVACTVIATAIPMTPSSAGMLWIVLSTASIIAARMFDAPHFVSHSIVYALAGAVATGLLGGAIGTITGLGSRATIALGPAIATAGIGIAAFVALLQRNAKELPWRVGKMTLLSLAALVVMTGVALFALQFAGAKSYEAAIRSGVIAFSAIALALISRTRLFSDCGVLVYPVLGVGAAKFAMDDLLNGTAATLFVTLAIYGSALLFLAKTRRGPSQRPAAQASS